MLYSYTMKCGLNLVLFLTVIGLYVCSCKKDKDELSPTIIVESPNINQEFDVFDIINVKAKITDDIKLESIEIVLTNENFIPVLSSVSASPQGKQTDINLNYEIYDNFLESGKYYLLIKASDGVNTKHSYTEIYIYESPTYLTHILALTGFGANNYELLEIDSGFNTKILGSGTSEHLASDYNSRYQQLYISGQIMDDVIALDMPDLTLAYSISCIPNPPASYFTSISYMDKLLYVLFYDGNIKAYDNRGNIKYSTQTAMAKYPLKVFRHQGYLLIYQKDYVGLNGTIGLCYYPNSIIMQSLDVNYEIIDFASKDEDNVFVFANKSNQGEIYIYNIKNNLSTELYSVAGGKIQSFCRIDETRFLIVIGNEIMLFKYNPLSLTTYISNIFVKSLKFDELNNVIYIAESNKISTYVYPSTVAKNQTVLNNSILDFHLVFNK